jgi:hypothetical protein
MCGHCLIRPGLTWGHAWPWFDKTGIDLGTCVAIVWQRGTVRWSAAGVPDIPQMQHYLWRGQRQPNSCLQGDGIWAAILCILGPRPSDGDPLQHIQLRPVRLACRELELMQCYL